MRLNNCQFWKRNAKKTKTVGIVTNYTNDEVTVTILKNGGPTIKVTVPSDDIDRDMMIRHATSVATRAWNNLNQEG